MLVEPQDICEDRYSNTVVKMNRQAFLLKSCFKWIINGNASVGILTKVFHPQGRHDIDNAFWQFFSLSCNTSYHLNPAFCRRGTGRQRALGHEVTRSDGVTRPCVTVDDNFPR